MIEARSFDIGGESEEAEFSNQVEIRTPQGTITAASATLDQNNVAVAGRVTFTGPDVKVYGEDAQFDREAQTMQFSAAGFDLPQRPARGSAEEAMAIYGSALAIDGRNEEARRGMHEAAALMRTQMRRRWGVPGEPGDPMPPVHPVPPVRQVPVPPTPDGGRRPGPSPDGN